MTLEYLNKMALWSSADPDTQTACVIIAGPYRIEGSNRIPCGINCTPERVMRPAKYTFIQHAEINAICSAAQQGISLQDAALYLNWFPCATCAAAMIQSGIKKLFADREKYEQRINDPRYGFADSMAMLIEAGVTVEWLSA